MIDPYRMVVINVLSLILLGVGILIYKFVRPKKDPNLLILLILISLLPLISLLRAGSYESGDLSYNIYNTMEYFTGLSEGQILPQWAGYSNATYGYPLFVFIYPLPYIIASFFHFLGFTFVASMKLFIAGSFVISGIAMYYSVKEDLGKIPAFVASLFYLFAPYHLVDTHFRVSTGEIASFALLPITFYLVRKVILENRLKWLLLLTAALTGLVLANQAIALVAYAFLGSYVMLFWYRQKKRKLQTLLFVASCFGTSLLLSAFYWLPAIFEAAYTHQSSFVKQIGYVQIPQMLYSTFRHGFLYQGPHGELSFTIGFAQLGTLLLAIVLIVRGVFSKKERFWAIFAIFATLLFCFLMTSYSKVVWDNISILRNFQFTFRLLLFVAFCTSFLAGLVASKLNHKLIIILCLVVILQTTLNWGNRRNIPAFDDATLRSQLPLNTGKTSGFHPAVPKWVDIKNPWMNTFPKSYIEVLDGKATFKQIKRTQTLHQYVVNVREKSYLKENTLYFPGWTAKINGKNVNIRYDNPKYPGVITLRVPAGLYLLELKFEDTPIVRSGKMITLASIGIITLLVLARKRLRFLPKL